MRKMFVNNKLSWERKSKKRKEKKFNPGCLNIKNEYKLIHLLNLKQNKILFLLSFNNIYIYN